MLSKSWLDTGEWISNTTVKLCLISMVFPKYSIVFWLIFKLIILWKYHFSCCKCPEEEQECKNHCLNKCPDQKIFHGRILYLEGSLNGARANVSCDGGFHIIGQSTCEKTETIYCRKFNYGSSWSNHASSVVPTCERMGK